jgi:hypothetical protein
VLESLVATTPRVNLYVVYIETEVNLGFKARCGNYGIQHRQRAIYILTLRKKEKYNIGHIPVPLQPTITYLF